MSIQLAPSSAAFLLGAPLEAVLAEAAETAGAGAGLQQLQPEEPRIEAEADPPAAPAPWQLPPFARLWSALWSALRSLRLQEASAGSERLQALTAAPLPALPRASLSQKTRRLRLGLDAWRAEAESHSALKSFLAS